MFHTSVIEISKSALKNNLDFLQNLMGDVRISSVVKGNAYGHGIEHFVPLAEECGMDHFSVFSADEAWRVLQCAHRKPTIMIMGMIDDAQLKWAVEHDVEFFVFDLHRLHEAAKAAAEIGKPARIHIELETGMNRTGLPLDEMQEAVRYINQHSKHLTFQGLCTHYAGAESIANFVRIKDQIKRYKTAYRLLSRQNTLPNIRHTACSAASIRYPETRYNLVRMGILQYGFWPSREIFIEYNSKLSDKSEPLQPLISWRSKVMDVKSVKTGEFVGYGTSFLATSDMKIATVPIGYSHGFSRSLSNTGRALVNGHRVGVIGIVNMNALTLDVTSVEQVDIGDEVVLIGDQGNKQISVSSFGELSDQLNYELLTRLPMDIPRKVVD